MTVDHPLEGKDTSVDAPFASGKRRGELHSLPMYIGEDPSERLPSDLDFTWRF